MNFINLSWKKGEKRIDKTRIIHNTAVCKHTMGEQAQRTVQIKKGQGIWRYIAKYELKEQYKGKVTKKRLKVEIWLYFKTRTKRDIDNYNKAILDSLKGIVIEDDELIDDLAVHKIKGHGKDKVYIEILERGN